MVHYSESSIAFAHASRKLILLSYIPCFVLCIVGSCVSSRVLPGLALIPFSASALLSIVTLFIARRQRKRSIQLPAGNTIDEDGGKAPVLLNAFAVFTYDVSLATSLMVVMIFIWTQDDWSRSVEVDTFATVPLLLTFIIHVYLALLALIQAFQYALKREAPSVTCPNCNTKVRTKSRFSWFRRQTRSGQYSALGDEYHDGAQDEMSERKNAGGRPADEAESSNVQGKGKATEEPSLSPVDE
ncbi:hypothetical protein NLU13_8233 [Sarocladium strictum]|uniref:Uncharacterized protein n=1 Tax=Sarocladium strictum TaxID=5046 RepID=A0AA39GCQ2_SARSR|nr:hypothetical protein NLU13_8233 [Sarocladium strictum]